MTESSTGDCNPVCFPLEQFPGLFHKLLKKMFCFTDDKSADGNCKIIILKLIINTRSLGFQLLYYAANLWWQTTPHISLIRILRIFQLSVKTKQRISYKIKLSHQDWCEKNLYEKFFFRTLRTTILTWIPIDFIENISQPFQAVVENLC